MSDPTRFQGDRPFEELLSKELVTIFVGPKRKEYHIHKDLICARSKFFRTAFAGNFKESEEQTIYLQETDPEIFNLLVRWIYGSPLKAAPKHTKNRSVPILMLYLLADELCIEALKNHMVEVMKDSYRSGGGVNEERLKVVYENTLPGNHMRRLLLDICAKHLVAKPKELNEGLKALILKGGEVALDLVEVLRTDGTYSERNPFAKNCVYHEHQETAQCEW